MGWIVSALVSVGLAVLVGWALPAWAIRRLLPVLEGAGHLVTNYRGRRIPTGLGLVWIVWAAGVGVVSALLGFVSRTVGGGGMDYPVWLWSAPIHAAAGAPLLLVVGAAAFGLVDDLFGGHGVKGFRGHLRELAAGRLSTGGLKLFGIGLLALIAGAGTQAATEPLLQSAPVFGIRQSALALAGWACASLVIALAANLVNLTDLRPGRAIKAYGLLAGAGCVWAGLVMWQFYRSQAAALIRDAQPTPVPAGVQAIAWALCLIVLMFGPVLAVWRFDLGERAMLGDAGANAMGALAGFLLVRQAPLWLAAVLALLLLALNLASERVSFSSVIERTAFLKWMDGLGRMPAGAEGATGQDDGTRAGGPAAEGDDA